MPAYMYPIVIKKDRQKVRYTKDIELDNDGVLTLSILRTYVNEDECFSIVEKRSVMGCAYLLRVSGQRLETKDECTARVEKEEKYMAEYNKRHNIK